MSVTWVGTSGLATKLGKLALWARNLNGIRAKVAPAATSGTPKWGTGGATIKDSETAYSEILAQFESTNTDVSLVSGLPAQLDNFRQSLGNQLTTMQSLAQSALVSMVNADSPLSNLSLANAMSVLLYQTVNTTGYYFTGNTVTATVAAGDDGNVGSPAVIASVTDHNGAQLQWPFAEVVTLQVTSDVARGATAGNEPMSATGTIANSDPLSQTWPQGSGISGVSLNVVNYASDVSEGNLLTNSSFETFTVANTPDQWTTVVGTIGTQIKKGTTTHSTGSSYSLNFVGDSSTLTSVKQKFNDGTIGTAGILKSPPMGAVTSVVSDGVYAFSGWVYVDVQPAAGVLKIDLVDSNNNVINDNGGNANTITRTLSTLTSATWTNVTGFFRMPTNLPATVSIRLRLSTALSSTRNLFIDDCALANATQLYVGGPFVAAFRGATDVSIIDFWTVTVANNMGSTAGGIFMEFFERFFGMRATLGMVLPVSGSTLIADSLAQ